MFQSYEYIISFFLIIITCYFIIIIPTIEAQTNTTILAELETPINGNLVSGSIINYVYNIKTLKYNPKSPLPSSNNDDIFITITTCKIPLRTNPKVLLPASPLEVYISTKLKNPGPKIFGGDGGGDKHISNEGYLSIITKENNDNMLYVGVYAPKLSGDYSNDDYYFEIGVSTKGSIHQVPTEKGLMLDDTDGSDALFRTFYTSTEQPLYNTYYVESIRVDGISKSLCAYIKNGWDSRNVSYSRWEKDGKHQSSIFISNLNVGTKYSALVTEVSNDGFKLFKPEIFQTQSKNNCAIIKGLEFCDKVFYSAPKTVSIDNQVDLAIGYDNLAKSYFNNFTLTMDQYACNDSDSRYSLVRNCNDCKEAYKDWICAIVIPRCANEDLNDFGKERYKPRIDSMKINQPFIELPPCIDLCYNVTRSCPANIFTCPNTKAISSYGSIIPTDNDQNISCNALGMPFPSKSSVSIRILSSTQRMLIILVLVLTILIVGM